MDFVYINNVKTYFGSNRDELIDLAVNGKKALIAVTSEKIFHDNKQIQQIINNNIGYTDGMGAVWALERNGYKNVVKIRGCDLWLDIVGKLYKEKSFYLIGSTQETIEKTVAKLKKEFEGINIVNFRNGFFKNDFEKKAVLDDIVLKKPDIVFVALGSPKQEFFISEMQKVHQAVYQGLGGSFDLYIGNVKSVPIWWSRISKIEGLYRAFADFNNKKRWKREWICFKFLTRIWINRINGEKLLKTKEEKEKIKDIGNK